MRVLELYSGIGGMHFALKESGLPASVVGALDINTTANAIYKHNFPTTPILNKTLESVSLNEFDDFSADLVLMSPPCQPYCGVGKQLDIDDPRAKSLLYFFDILLKLRKPPKYIILENVKGFDTSKSRNYVTECLEKLKYSFEEFLLSPLQFGIPNSRQRYYLLAKLKPLEFSTRDGVVKAVPKEMYRSLLHLQDTSDNMETYKSVTTTSHDHGYLKFHQFCLPLKDFLEKLADNEFQSLLLPEKLFKRFWVMDLVNEKSQNSCCFTKRYGHHMEGSGSLLITSPEQSQTLFELKEKKIYTQQVYDAIKSLQIRFFSPKEIANIMCFPQNFSWPKNFSSQQLYRVLGNSLNVHVVSCLLKYLVTEAD